MDVRTGENPKTENWKSTADCRTSLRVAIAAPHYKRRNWVQIVLTAFCLSGLGFNISAKDRAQLQCIADNGNGLYFDAANAAGAFAPSAGIRGSPPCPGTGRLRHTD